MVYGTDEFFQFVLKHIGNENDLEFYNVLLEIVRNDAMSVLSKYDICHEDKKDIVLEVQCVVCKEIQKQLKMSEYYEEAQRKAWLKRVIANKINDYFRKAKNYDDSLEEIEEKRTDKKALKKLSYSPFEKIRKSDYIEEELLSAIRGVCSINTSPGNIVGCLFNRVIGSVLLGRNNGSPQKVREMLKNKSIDEATEIMIEIFKEELNMDVPDDIFAELFRKNNKIVNGIRNGDKKFELTEKNITDCSNWIGKKMRDKRDKTKGNNTAEKITDKRDKTKGNNTAERGNDCE